jgi:hypothetical protein
MDNDFFSADDYVSGNQLELQRLIKDVYALDVPVKFDTTFWEGLTENERKNVEVQFKDGEKEKFWLQLYKQGTVNYFLIKFLFYFFLEWLRKRWKSFNIIRNFTSMESSNLQSWKRKRRT